MAMAMSMVAARSTEFGDGDGCEMAKFVVLVLLATLAEVTPTRD